VGILISCTTSPGNSGKYSQPERPVNDRGNAIKGNEQQLNRWAEHFEELLKTPATHNPPDILPADTDIPNICENPTKLEIRASIKPYKMSKL